MVNFMLVTLFLMFVKVMPSMEDELPNGRHKSIHVSFSLLEEIPEREFSTEIYLTGDQLKSAQRDRRAIRSAMDEIEKHTCIRWVPIRDEDISKHKSYLSIENDWGCWSHPGRTGTIQSLSLDRSRCLNRGTILHELLHALGFLHEHQRPDRDEYVTVNWDNILEGGILQFVPLDPLDADTLGLAYDYRSVLHYAAYRWAVNTSIPTLKPNLIQSNLTLEDLGHGLQHGYLTELDIQRINKFYECSF